MDIFEDRYFNFSRTAFDYMGIWPYGPKTRNIRKYSLLFVLIASSVPQITSFIVNFEDIDRAMLNLVMLIIAIIVSLKLFCMIIAERKMKALFRDIADNWQGITDEKEKKILIEYGESGHKKAVYYFAFMQIGGNSLFFIPPLAKLFDIMFPLENPRPKIHILEDELLVDREQYYIIYYIWDSIVIIINATVCVTVDGMYIICVEHCCALYAVIRYRLHNLGSKMFNASEENEKSYHDYVCSIIELHQKALDFTTTINKAFSSLFFCILMANLVGIPILAVTTITNLDKPFNCIRFAMLFVVLAVHLYMLFWPGQNVLDQSRSLTDDAYNNEWYAVPLQARKMIVIFMIRCTQPALLTAGGLMLMNFETYSSIMRKAISYITVAASFR